MVPLAVVAVVVIAVGAFAVLGSRPPSGARSAASPAAISLGVTSLPQAELDQVGDGGQPAWIKAVSGVPPSAAPVVFYIGADYCPYCAAARWTLVQALGRFGTFSSLKLTTSSSSDVFPDTPTFSFTGSSFASDYLRFAAVETADRERRPLEPIPAALQPLVNRYNPGGNIPFSYVDGRYFASGSNYPPDLLKGLDWSQVVDQLKDPASPLTRAVVGNANQLTAALCQVTSGKPASVCTSAAVRTAHLPPR